MNEPYIRCDYQGGLRHDRCPNEAAWVALWAGRPVRRARRCERHTRQARELGYDLRPVTLGERAEGQIDRRVGIKPA